MNAPPHPVGHHSQCAPQRSPAGAAARRVPVHSNPVVLPPRVAVRRLGPVPPIPPVAPLRCALQGSIVPGNTPRLAAGPFRTRSNHSDAASWSSRRRPSGCHISRTATDPAIVPPPWCARSMRPANSQCCTVMDASRRCVEATTSTWSYSVNNCRPPPARVRGVRRSGCGNRRRQIGSEYSQRPFGAVSARCKTHRILISS